MTNDVKVAIVFVVMLILVCRAWSCFGVRQYKKNKIFYSRWKVKKK